MMSINSFEGCDKKPVYFGTIQDFLSFDGSQVCTEGHAYVIYLAIAMIQVIFQTQSLRLHHYFNLVEMNWNVKQKNIY